VTGADALTGRISYSSCSEWVAAGSYTVMCDFAGTDNYTATSGTATIVINKATASVTAGGGTKVYGTAGPGERPVGEGLQSGDYHEDTTTEHDAGGNVGQEVITIVRRGDDGMFHLDY